MQEAGMKRKKITAVLLAGACLASLALCGCGNEIDENAVVATMGDREVSLGYANFAAHYNQLNYDSVFVSYYGEGYWTNEQYADEDGKTMEDSVKEYVMDDIEMGYLLEDHMADYGVEVTDEDRAAIKAAADKFMSDNSREAVRKLGAASEYVEDFLYYETVKSRMTEAIEAGADTEVSDEECARRTFSYIQIDLDGHTDETTGEYVTYTEEERDAVLQNVDAVAEMAKSDFEAAADAYSYSVSSYSYGRDEADESEGGFDNAVIAAADTMSEGEISDAIEGADCYYIIRLDSENDEEAAQSAKESIIQDRKSAIYDEVTEGYKKDSDFKLNEEEWAKVTFDDMFAIAQEEDLSAPQE